MAKNEPSRRDWLALGVAAMSMVIALTVAWFSALSPADISVRLNSVQFGGRFGESSGQSSKHSLMVVATCAFANNGARSGQIDMLALRFDSQDDSTQWLYTPYVVVDDARLVPQLIPSAIKSRFSPVVLPGKQTATYTYMFFTDDTTLLAPHKFKVSLFSWMPDQVTPTEQEVRTLDLKELYVAFLKQSTSAGGDFLSVGFEETAHQLQSLRQTK